MNLTPELTTLLLTAASIGFFHTLFGPDHYLPFIVMAQSGKWSPTKTALITFVCGIGHVTGSVALGIIGIAVGAAVTHLEFIESFRGNLAAWGLIAFGLAYGVWGLRQAYRNRSHSHFHHHGDGMLHSHQHKHVEGHVHIHAEQKQNMTPWILFTIFIFGPCEPLIPLLMYPAAKHNISGLMAVTGVFSIVTIGTMLTIVLISGFGISFLPLRKMERYSHALAGFAIFLCGISIRFLGL
jgi:nickel/cobalt exporter